MAPTQPVYVQINVDNTQAYIGIVKESGQVISEYVAKRIVSTMKGSMRGPKSGRVYERGGVRYQASRGGEAPAVPPAAWRRGFQAGFLDVRRTRSGLIKEVRGRGAFFRKNRGAALRLEQLTDLATRKEKRGGRMSLTEIAQINARTERRIQRFYDYLHSRGIRQNLRSYKERGRRGRVDREGFESELPGGLIETIKAESIRQDGSGSEWGITMHELGLWLEFGTERFAARPFIIPAVEKWRPQVPKLYSEYINKAARAQDKAGGRSKRGLVPASFLSIRGEDQ
jgi:hypothetical protein